MTRLARIRGAISRPARSGASAIGALLLAFSGVSGTTSSPEDTAPAARIEFSFEDAAGRALEPVAIRGELDEAPLSFTGVISGDPRAGAWTVRLYGGFVLRSRTAPVYFYEATIQVDPEGNARIRPLETRVPVPVVARPTRAPAGDELLVADLAITESWAGALGDPSLAGQRLGALTVRGHTPQKSEALAPAPPDRPPFLDVSLGQLYDIRDLGYVGEYPTGTVGLSAATTSCNLGEVDVPWRATMMEDHPFITLQLYRLDATGTLEMIGRNWLKHSFQALSDEDCTPCQNPSPGSFLGVGCSDTYSALNNAWSYYLGPREEVDPYLAGWTACGSFFDGTPVDCQRNYNGELDLVSHRIEIYDGDLTPPGARYFYEGGYFVHDDDDISNNVGWQECTVEWLPDPENSWEFTTLDGPDPQNAWTPHYGALILTWGDVQDTKALPGDGLVMHAVRVTDLGGGSWHYEYALYNRNSDRRLRSFSVPVGAAQVTNPGFHDHDRDAGNDWIVSQAGGRVTWSTDDWATDPGAPAIVFGTMVNFRFDADLPPVDAIATGGIFKPGLGTSVAFDTRAPSASSISRAAISTAPSIDGGRPNPFSTTTTLRFTVPRAGPVRLSVHDLAGRTVRVLADGPSLAGAAEAVWDGRDGRGSFVANGVYFYRLEAPGGTRTTRGTLVR